jgi:hypothetical protein
VKKLSKKSRKERGNPVEPQWTPVEAGSRRERVVALVLLALLALQLVLALRADGLTIDEIVYIGAGYRHLTALDYRLNPEQPPIAKLLGAIPLTVARVKIGTDDSAAVGEWRWGFLLVHVWNEAARVVSWARLPDALLTLALAALLWAWSRGRFGPLAGLAALALAAFHPSLLAHGHLLTTDLPGTFGMVVASWAFWRWTQAPSLPRALGVGAALALALGTRLTGWLLLPTFLLLEAPRLLPGRGDTEDEDALPRHGLRDVAVLVGVSAVVAWGALWALYGFRYAPWPGATIAENPGEWLGAPGRLVAALERYRLLPEAYLEGARFVLAHNAGGHQTYLLGKVSSQGWPYYYLVAFLVKNTPGFLLAALVALLGLVGRGRALVRGGLEAHWLVPAAVMFGAASAGHIQIGERYILPIYPYLILLIAARVPAWTVHPVGRVCAAALLALHVGPALWTQPAGYLPYFNLLAGALDGERPVLADSNLDWGQDLPRLAAWMRDHDVDTVHLGYHGCDLPERYGISHDDLPGMLLYATHAPQPPVLGVAAVSPNLLLGIFYPPTQNPYERLLLRPPDDRAGVYFIYRLRPGEIVP